VAGFAIPIRFFLWISLEQKNAKSGKLGQANSRSRRRKGIRDTLKSVRTNLGKDAFYTVPDLLFKHPALHELSGIENALGIKSVLDGPVQGTSFLGNRQRPPALFGQTDAVLAGDGAAPGNHLREQFV
jgi:hypothetical protein